MRLYNEHVYVSDWLYYCSRLPLILDDHDRQKIRMPSYAKIAFPKLLLAGLWQCRETKVVGDKDVHDPAEVVEGVHVNGTDVVVSRMPYGREWIRDEMHDLDAASHKRQMIVLYVDSLHVSGLAKRKKGQLFTSSVLGSFLYDAKVLCDHT